MKPVLIQYHLDLLINLVDTTTGSLIEQRNVRLYHGDELLKAINKGTGTYILYNTGRKDFVLKACVQGYEEQVTGIEYKSLDERQPFLTLYLIPSRSHADALSMCTLEGNLPGIVELEAVALGAQICEYKEFDARKKILTVINPHKRSLEAVHYAIVNQKEMTYEHVTVVRNITVNTLKLDRIPKIQNGADITVNRIIFGSTDPQGRYLFKARNDSSQLKYLIRYLVKDSERFKCVDFNQPDTMMLT
jgi:hypothetical protein